jgi:hypothetical protein
MATRFDVFSSKRISEKSGLCTGIAAGGSIFVFRNAHATSSALIRRIEVAHLITTGYTAAQEVGYHVVKGSTWTAAPSGGTALTITGNFAKLRNTDSATILTAGDVRVATTGTLTDGTVAADSHLLGADSCWGLAATAGNAIGWNAITFDETPLKGLLLAQNEGFLIKNTIAQGAAGVGRWFVNVVWDEGVVV